MAVSKQWVFHRKVLAKTYNVLVKEYFGDISGAEDDFTVSRKALFTSCFIGPKDGQQMAILKMNFFFNVVLEVQDRPAVYGMPITTFKENYSYYPQVMCHWKERDDIAKANNRRPIRAQCAIRYTGDISSKADITALATKVKQVFGTPQHHFTKGRYVCTYWDKLNSIEMKAHPSTQADAESVFKAMIALRAGVTFNDDFLCLSQFPNKNWTPTGTEMVAGQALKEPKRRIPGEVYFEYAELKHHRLKEDIVLFSLVPQRRKASFL